MLTNISGFPELLPKDQIAFNKILTIIKDQFELHGFIPLDTPAVERASTLLAKGNDNEIYGLYRLAEQNEVKVKDLALRFDLTVPLARYVAQHHGKITFPYLRYHIAPVWRGERPQAGRYRQFYQCDIDIIGDQQLPLIYDAQALAVIYTTLLAIGVEQFVIKINNRNILTGLLKEFGLSNQQIPEVIRVIDKAEQLSQESLIQELAKHQVNAVQVETLIQLSQAKFANITWLEYLPTLCHNPEFLAGIEQLQEVFTDLQHFGVPQAQICIDPTLARGLNYYTGTVAEIKLPAHPELGSIGGGGRYANLVANFSNRQLPGVGFSIGISRLIPYLIKTGIIDAVKETVAPVLVTTQDPALKVYYLEIANILRKNKINTEVYLAPSQLGAQLKYASKKGFSFVIIANATEAQKQQVILRALGDGKQELVNMDQAVQIIKKFCIGSPG